MHVRYDSRFISKWSLIGLNSEFSFFYTDCHTKVKELSLPNYLPIDGVVLDSHLRNDMRNRFTASQILTIH